MPIIQPGPLVSSVGWRSGRGLTDPTERSGLLYRPSVAAVELLGSPAGAGLGGVATLAGSGPDYPDLPLIREFGFNTLEGSGWYVLDRDGEPTLETDATGPISAPAVVQFNFPTGFPDGLDGGVAFTGLGNVEEVFVRLWFQASPGWQHHTNNFKHCFLLTNGRRVYSNFTRGGFVGMIHFNDDGMGGTPNIGSTCVSGNCDRGTLPDEAEVRDGEWQELAIHGAMNGDGTADFRWWVDGHLIGTEENRDLAATRFEEFNIVGTWGGGGSAKVQDDWIRYDHCWIYGE